MPKALKVMPAPKAPAEPKPDKFVMKAPRLKPTQTRNYGKGQSVVATGPNPSAFGSGIGYGGS